jgi:osmoprotectant transport system permease protein
MVLGTIPQFLSDNSSLILSETGWTLKLFGAAFALSLLIAVPLGLWLGHLHRFRFVAINLSNIGRSLPSLAVISIGIAVIGLGFNDVMIALVILAVPVILTNAYISVDSIDRDLVQAARGMGMTGWQILRGVELPLAIPLLFAGIRTAALYVMATTPLAAVSGAPGGLGDIIANQASYRFVGVATAALVITVLAFAVEGAFALLQRALTPRGVRPVAGRVVAPNVQDL